MNEFTVQLVNRPGALAALTEALTSAGVRIEALAAFGVLDDGHVRLITDDAERTRGALRTAGLRWDERKVLTARIADRPDALSSLARHLADAGINVDAMYLLNTGPDGREFAIAVDRIDLLESERVTGTV